YSFRRKEQRNISKSMLLVDYQLEVTGQQKNSLTIEMRIGSNRPYIIRDIREFLKAYRKEEEYQLNRSFTYEPGIHVFSKEDREMVELLLMCLDQENLFGHTYFGRLENSRALLVPPVISYELLEMLQKTNYTFKHHKYTQTTEITVKTLTDELDFQLDFHPSSDVYSMAFAD